MSRRFPGPLNDPWFTTSVALMGLVAGIALWILTIVLSRAHLSGNGLSLSGNGVLIIPFGIGPAIVAGGWAAIILRMRAHRRWLQLGMVTAAVGLVLVAGSLLALITFGPGARDAGATASIFLGFLLYGWLLAGPMIAAMIPAPDLPRDGPPFWSIAALVLLPVTLIAGCDASTAVLPV